MKYLFLSGSISMPFLSALGQVHQSFQDVLQAKGKCISQRNSLHPCTLSQEQVRKGLGSSQSPLPALAIWEVNVLAFCSHLGVDIPQDACVSCFWNVWVSANLLSCEEEEEEGGFIIEDSLLGADLFASVSKTQYPSPQLL